MDANDRAGGVTAPSAWTRQNLLWVAIGTIALFWALRDLAVLVGYSVLLAYALQPVVNGVQRLRGPGGRSLPRGVVAGGLMAVIALLVGWLIALAVPQIASEATHFATNAPEVLAGIVRSLRENAAERGLSAWLDPALEGMRTGLAGLVQNAGGMLANGAARLFGGIGNLLGLALVPLLACYLLADSEAIRESALRFLPEGAGAELTRLSGAIDRALRSYVRGQVIVCLVNGVLVGAGLAAIHHPVALLLGLVVGAAELIPFLGFTAAAAAIALAGFSVSPFQALEGLVVYVALNWAIGTFVSPRVMGRYLKMHPFVVTVSVLAGAQLLGPAGALLALPGSAVMQAIISELAPASSAPRPRARAPHPGRPHRRGP